MDICQTCETHGPHDDEVGSGTLPSAGRDLHRAMHEVGAQFMLTFEPVFRTILRDHVDEERVAKWHRIADKARARA